jgi:spermidine synthase
VAISLEQGILSTPALREHLSVFGGEVHAYAWWLRLVLAAGVASLILLPAVLCMGLSFPLASRLYLGSVERIGARIGGAVLLANLGSILGSVGAALVILPMLGTVDGTRAVCLLNLLLGVAVLAALDEPIGRRAALAVGAGALVLLLGLEQQPRLGFVGGGPGGELVFEEEGELSTVQVWVDPAHEEHRAMAIDGTVIGVSAGWYAPLYAKQRLLAHLPMVLDPGIRRTLNVGLGSGSTVEALAIHADVSSLHAVEINGGVLRGAHFFEEAAVFDDPRVEIHIEDAFYHLLRAREPYDLVIGDGKQNDDFSGNARVLSLEFYERSFSRLSPRGLFVQWLPLDTKASDLRIVVRTFVTVFPEVELFFQFPGSVMLVGSRMPIGSRVRMSEAQLQTSGALADLSRIGIETRASLLALWMASREDLAAVIGPGPINDWNSMPIEWSAYRNVRIRDGVRVDTSPSENYALLHAASQRASQREPLFGSDHVGPALDARRMLRDAWMANLEGRPALARQLACRASALVPTDPTLDGYCKHFERSTGPEGRSR